MRSAHLLPGLSHARRLRLLCILSSAINPHSALLLNLRQLAHRTAQVEFELAVDDFNPDTTEAVVQLAAELEAPVHIGRGPRVRSIPLPANRDLPALMACPQWDAVECVGLHTAVTVAPALGFLGPRTLIYTPHHRTHWGASLDPESVDHLGQAHRHLLRKADATLCATRYERAQLQSLGPARNTCYHLPIGCDFSRFPPGPDNRPSRLLFLGNPAKPGNHFDRALATLRLLRVSRPSLSLLVLNPDTLPLVLPLPADLQQAVEYQRQTRLDQLPQAFTRAAGLLLLSDDASFGLPILLALATRTPAFVNQIPACFSAFGVFQGATFCPGGDAEATARIISGQLDKGPTLINAMRQDEHHLRRTFDVSRLALRKWELLAAAWFRRNRHALSA